MTGNCKDCDFSVEMVTHTFAINDCTVDGLGPLPENRRAGKVYCSEEGEPEAIIQFSYTTEWLECRAGKPKESTGLFLRYKGWPAIMPTSSCGQFQVSYNL